MPVSGYPVKTSMTSRINCALNKQDFKKEKQQLLKAFQITFSENQCDQMYESQHN